MHPMQERAGELLGVTTGVLSHCSFSASKQPFHQRILPFIVTFTALAV